MRLRKAKQFVKNEVVTDGNRVFFTCYNVYLDEYRVALIDVETNEETVEYRQYLKKAPKDNSYSLLYGEIDDNYSGCSRLPQNIDCTFS